MKKQLLMMIMLMIAFASHSFAQRKQYNSPGEHLIAAKENYITGIAVSTVSTTFGYFLIASGEPGTGSLLIIGGSVFGVIKTISAFSHIGKAGQMMSAPKPIGGLQFNYNGTSASIAYRF